MAKKRRQKDHTDTMIGVYFTKQERDDIIAQAAAQNKTVSEYCREPILTRLYNDVIDSPSTT